MVEAHSDTIQLDLMHEIGSALMRTLDHLKALCLSNLPDVEKLQDNFFHAINDIIGCKFEDLSVSDGAFIVKDGVAIFDLQPILHIIRCVVDEMRQTAVVGAPLASDQIKKVIIDTLLVYFLHELRHRTQGIEKKSSVVAIKKISGDRVMSQFDLMADRDAVSALAMVLSGGKKDKIYWEEFKKGMWLSPRYFFSTFNFSKPVKRERAASIMLMLARITLAEYKGFTPSIPLDTLIEVNFDPDGNMVVYDYDKSKMVAGTVAANDNEAFLSALNCMDIDAALEYGIQIIDKLSRYAQG